MFNSKISISPLFNEDCLDNAKLRNKVINYIKTDTCIGATIKTGVFWESWMFKYIKNNYIENTNIIDLGGNIGTSMLLMSEVLSNKCNIFSFEPIYHDILLKNVLDNNLHNNVKIFPYGVGNKIEQIKINPINLTSNRNFGAISLMENKNNNGEEITIVPVDYFNFENVSLIKIDVENMEIEVLQGCLNLIKKCKPTILIETHDIKKLTNSIDFEELIKLGYSIKQIPEGCNDYIIKIN